MSSDPPSPQTIRFGTFEADLATGEVRKSGQRVRVENKPFQVLALLIERPGKLVTREELQTKLWPADTFVEFDQNLHSAIKKVRRALGDSAESPKFVETLPKRGYRFIYPIGVGSPSPAKEASLPHSTQVDDKTVTPSRVRMFVWMVAAAIVLAVGVWIVQSLREPAPIAGTPEASVAVLPLENLSGDREQEYFSDGMTEALISELSKIGALKVIARTSAMRYKDTEKSLKDIARELNVAAVVEGSVLQAEGQVRVTAHLIDVSSERSVWSDSYQRELKEILALQSDVARAIAEQIMFELTPLEAERISTARVVDPEAHDAYLKGRHLLFNNYDDLKAMTYFQQAIDKDPNYAPAYAGLAGAYLLAGEGADDIPPAVAAERAKTAVRRALELDGTLAFAHHINGVIKHGFDWDWSGAERTYERAITLSPGDAEIRVDYASNFMVLGRHKEGIRQMKLALQLNPLSSLASALLGYHYFAAGRYDEAIEQYQRTGELHGHVHYIAQLIVGQIYLERGAHERGIFEIQNAMLEAGDDLRPKGWLGYGYALAGRRDEALAILDELKELSQQRYVSPYIKAVVYLGLRDRDRMFAALEEAYEDRVTQMASLYAFPWWDPVRLTRGFKTCSGG